ncbi:WD repeat and SOCS box-containing protein 1 [Armadillidium nasatum]|uniref:WD repeat and SOCS box-containing protein 1 n=1 Tax=Armadillidium nasatum TaxID=96803 RepID=A0A5N5THN2_9CRUS|nr:WD repeat and SOCS box-containing protein 1 [Armadillidium nasatum]
MFKRLKLYFSERALVIGELLTGREGSDYDPISQGRFAFAPDESLFAWSCGFRKLVLVPWSKYKSRLHSQEGDSFGSSFLSERISIDAGFQVCSLAFGTGVPDGNLSHLKRDYWTRFNFSQDLTLATGHINGRIRIWDPYTGKLLLELTDHKFAVNSLAFAHDGSLRLASGSQDGTIKVWDLSDDGNMFKTLSDKTKIAFRDLSWSPNSKLLCSVGIKQKAFLWNMEEYSLHKRLVGHLNDVNASSFSPDGALVATASSDTTVIIWDTNSGEILRFLNHTSPPPGVIYMSGVNDFYVKGVSFSQNGCQLISTCSDGILRFWDLTNGNFPEEIGTGNDDDMMLLCSYSPDGGSVAVCFASGSTIFYKSPTKIPSLLHLCRTAVRKALKSSVVEEMENTLSLPRTLYPFLRYQDW